MKRLLISLSLSFIILTGLSAKSWFVCAGSFSKQSLAQERCKILSDAGHTCFVEKTFNQDGDWIYRVFFYGPAMIRDDARARKDQLLKSKVVIENGFTDLWICEADMPDIEDPEVFLAVEPAVEPVKVVDKVKAVTPESVPIVLEANEEVPLSEENPYSVLVRSYREEEKAESDKERLREQDINAYVLKKFDDKAFFKFDLHAGAFETEEEAEDYIEELEEKGITGTEVSDYEDFAEDLAKYDEVVAKEEVTLNIGAYEMPEVISENVQKCISQFPINRDFQIVEAKILDCVNLRNSTESISTFMTNLPDDVIDLNEVESISYAKYRDELFNKELTVYIFQSEDEIPGIETVYDYKAENSKKKDFQINYGVLHSFVLNEYENEVFLFGYTDDKKMAIVMSAENFSEKAFDAFMKSSYSDSSLLLYPQIRRTFYVLPHKAGTERNFLAYSLSKVNESYAEERGYVDWSIPIVGTWRAASYFEQNEETVSLAFFDLDYDYNAQKVHGMFMSEKSGNNISDSNKPVDVNGEKGWYLSGWNGNELSFAHSSYIISVDGNYLGEAELPELYELAEDLNIWK
ncbi:MAG: SPOR domain-containing protein [Treponema sp.]|nr:SPOR domain-containing protein [Treponema sp.]